MLNHGNVRRSRWTISSLCPSPCGGYPASSCLRIFQELGQEVAGSFVLALAGRACQVDCLAAAPVVAAADTVVVGQLGIDLVDCIAEPVAGDWSVQASANTVAVAVDIAIEKIYGSPAVVYAAVWAWPVTAPIAGQASLLAHTAFAAAAAGR